MTIHQQELEAMQFAHRVLCAQLGYGKLPIMDKNETYNLRVAADKLYRALSGMPEPKGKYAIVEAR